jgi:hypothetical protein
MARRCRAAQQRRGALQARAPRTWWARWARVGLLLAPLLLLDGLRRDQRASGIAPRRRAAQGVVCARSGTAAGAPAPRQPPRAHLLYDILL